MNVNKHEIKVINSATIVLHTEEEITTMRNLLSLCFLTFKRDTPEFELADLITNSSNLGYSGTEIILGKLLPAVAQIFEAGEF